MRNKCFFLAERDKEIMKCYARIVGTTDCKTQFEALTRVVNSPCKRFWVAPERAAKVIYHLQKGGDISDMAVCKQRMYTELYRRFLEKIKLDEYKDMGVSRICEILVEEEEAPEFYLQTETAMNIFIAERNKRRGRAAK